MITWTGKGFLALVIVAVNAILIQLISGMITQSNEYYEQHSSVLFGIGLMISTIEIFLLGRSLNGKKEKVYLDMETAERVVLKKKHTLFFIPMEYWAILTFIGGISLMIGGDAGTNTSHYTEGDVSFICPKEWAITDKSNYEDGHYVACEKSGSDASGLITIDWFGTERDLSELLELMKADLEEGFGQAGGAVNFSETETASFKGYTALTQNYTLLLQGIEFQGNIMAWDCNGRSFTTLFQEATEDHEENKTGFDEFKNSFECF